MDQYLNVLPLSFIVEYMSNLLCKDLLPPRPGMNAHHCHPNRPRSVPYGHLEVDVVGLHILSLQEVATDVGQECQNVSSYGLGVENTGLIDYR